MENLISMTDYVLEQYEKWKVSKVETPDDMLYILNTMNYAKFLSMPLEIKMFVPCDSENNVLEKELFSPIWEDYHNKEGGNHELYLHNLKIYNEYQKALSEVIFEDVSFVNLDDRINYRIFYKDLCIYTSTSSLNKTIEDLVKYNLKLTPNAKLKYKF